MVNAAPIDSHAHFDAFAAEGCVEAVVARARAAGLAAVVAVGGSPDANRLAVALAGRHEGFLFASVGFDRALCREPPGLAGLEELAGRAGVVAVGETGLDYHYGPDARVEQCALFDRMLELAARRRLPVIVHARDADADLLPRLRAHARARPDGAGRLGVVHCFTGTPGAAQAVVEAGFHVSFSGIATFRGAEEVRRAAAVVPEDRLLVETDAPYLAPVPLRGRRNEPAYLAHTLEALAAVRRCSAGHLAAITADNAAWLFGFRPGAAHAREGRR